MSERITENLCIIDNIELGNNTYIHPFCSLTRCKIGNNCIIGMGVLIEEGAVIGDNTFIWHNSHIGKNAVIGNNCKLGSNVEVASDVKIGNSVKVQNNVSIYYGVVLHDYVFVGPSAVFTNVIKPRADKNTPKEQYQKTIINKYASIGANATIICGNNIGESSIVGAGCVVVKDIPAKTTVVGNPARIVKYKL